MPAPFSPRTTTRLPRSIEVDVLEDLERAVELRQTLRAERRPAARRGLREAELRDLLLLADVAEPFDEARRPAVELVRGARLRGGRAHPVRLRAQRDDLALGVRSLAVAPPLVRGDLRDVRSPAHVVDVEDLAVRVEVEDAVHGRLEQLGVVADHDDAAGVATEEPAQPGDRVGVEVVRRLVEQQRLGAGEQHARELDPAPLAARERAEPLGEHALREAEAGRDRRGLRLSGPAAERDEALLERRVAAHRGLASGLVRGAHLRRRVREVAGDHVEATGGQDPVAREHLEVARARVLGQVGDRSGAPQRPARREGLAGEHPRERRLARAVPPDEADPVARGDLEGRPREQDPPAGGELEIGGGEHGFEVVARRAGTPRRAVGAHQHRAESRTPARSCGRRPALVARTRRQRRPAGRRDPVALRRCADRSRSSEAASSSR